MKYITLRRDDRLFYIEEERIQTVLGKPAIEKVPGADGRIEGISCYEGRLVVYYRLGRCGRTNCGVILEEQGEVQTGVAGEELGEEETEPEKLTAVINGVWEKTDD